MFASQPNTMLPWYVNRTKQAYKAYISLHPSSMPTEEERPNMFAPDRTVIFYPASHQPRPPYPYLQRLSFDHGPQRHTDAALSYTTDTSASTRASASSSETTRSKQDAGSQKVQSRTPKPSGFRPLVLHLPGGPSLREEMLPYTGEAEPDMKKFQRAMPTVMAITRNYLEDEIRKTT